MSGYEVQHKDVATLKEVATFLILIDVFFDALSET